MLDTSKQQLVFIHADGGTGKTYVTSKIFQKLASRGEICRCTCPTGVGASHLP
jgi:tRNA A37 threonylcarbamoyladenosine biosynthesis protein TsaE